MNAQPIIVLHNGGVRSLVAAATVSVGALKPRKLMLVHVREEGPAGSVRQEYVQRQSEFFSGSQIVCLELPRLNESRRIEPGSVPTALPLARWHRLMLAIAAACKHRAERLVWPAQVDGDFQEIAKITEQLVLLDHLVKLEGVGAPTIETPLLELSDQQVIELGGQLEVVWHLAWSCLGPGPQPCKACQGCQRRRRAFDRAGMPDTSAPAQKLAPPSARTVGRSSYQPSAR